ncbi:PH domain-containing protein [Phycicoccus sonneratiae]|nr:PH domain-containing protein [Phycicoccus sonneraticus]
MVPLGVALVFLAICTVVAVAMGVSGGWGVGDQLALVAFGLLVAGFLSRYAMIRAVPGPDGLTVRNLMTTRTVAWDEIVEVRFPDGDPWVSLELSDTDVLAVMAVQRVDGEEGRAEARRLAGLVRAHRGVSG